MDTLESLRDLVAALERERDAARQKEAALKSELEDVRAAWHRETARADALTARVEELEGTLKTEEAERIRCRDGWQAAEARATAAEAALSEATKRMRDVVQALDKGQTAGWARQVLALPLDSKPTPPAPAGLLEAVRAYLPYLPRFEGPARHAEQAQIAERMRQELAAADAAK